jgi:hypothetical protein
LEIATPKDAAELNPLMLWIELTIAWLPNWPGEVAMLYIKSPQSLRSA